MASMLGYPHRPHQLLWGIAMTYLCQAPKEYKDQSAKWRKAHPESSLLSLDHYILQPKYDGCCLIVDTSTREAYSRTGEPVLSVPHIIVELCDMFGPGFKVYAEAYIHGRKFPEISGLFRKKQRGEEKDWLRAVVWDAVRNGMEDEQYIARLKFLTGALTRKLWAVPTEVLVPNSLTANERAVAYQAAGGYDGVILRDPQAGWAPGAAKNGEVIKVKPRTSLDLQVQGWFPGTGRLAKAGLAGGIIVSYRGVRTEVGTGFDDKTRHDITQGVWHSIAEIEFLGITAEGKLREPSFKGWRFDKERAD